MSRANDSSKLGIEPVSAFAGTNGRPRISHSTEILAAAQRYGNGVRFALRHLI
jgi:hypothetical protein